MLNVKSALPIQSRGSVFGQCLKIAAMLCMAIMGVTAKQAFAQGAGVVEVLFISSLLSLPLFISWVIISRRSLRPLVPQAKNWRSLFLRIGLGLIGMTLGFTSIKMLPFAEATILIFTAPIFSALAAALFLKEKIEKKHWLAMGLGVAGVLIITQPDGSTALPVLGVLAGIGGAVLFGVCAVTLRVLAQKNESAEATSFCFTLSVTIAFGLAYFWLQPQVSQESFTMIALSAIFGTLGQLLNTLSFKHGSVSDLAGVEFTQIVWAMLLSYLFWSIVPVGSTLVGAAIIVASLFVVMGGKKPG